jgi:hypothetical protein
LTNAEALVQHLEYWFFDTPEGLIVRPFDADAVSRLAGKYKSAPGTPTVDDYRRSERAVDADRDDTRHRGHP